MQFHLFKIRRLVRESPVLRVALRGKKITESRVDECLRKLKVPASAKDLLELSTESKLTSRKAAKLAKAAEILKLPSVATKVAISGPPINLRINLKMAKLDPQTAVDAWSRGYRVSFDGVVNFPVSPRVLLKALKRGMPVYVLDTDDISDKHIKLCRYLRILRVANNKKVTFCPSSVIELDASGSDCGISDLNRCKNLKRLNISGNQKVSDSSLAGCDKIRTINARNATGILTCPSSVVNLNAGGNCGIGDSGLRNGDALRKLNAHGNPKITVCPSSVVRLNAGGACGIDNRGLYEADSLRLVLCIGNEKITADWERRRIKRCPPSVADLGKVPVVRTISTRAKIGRLPPFVADLGKCRSGRTVSTRAKIGRLPQSVADSGSGLAAGTIRETICYGPEGPDDY